MQALSPRFHKVPRVFFTLLAFLIFTVASIAGRQHFSAILSNFLAVVRICVATQLVIEYPPGKIAYWIAIWIVILVEEHYIFRRKSGTLGGYDLHAHDSPALSVFAYFLSRSPLLITHAFADRLPVGLAAAYVYENHNCVSC